MNTINRICFNLTLQRAFADKNIVAAFQGMHVSPGKQSLAWLPRKCDYRTDTQMDRQTTDKVIPMCRYASRATQKLLNSSASEWFKSYIIVYHYRTRPYILDMNFCRYFDGIFATGLVRRQMTLTPPATRFRRFETCVRSIVETSLL